MMIRLALRLLLVLCLVPTVSCRSSLSEGPILAENLGGMGYGLAWVMMEDYREEVAQAILQSNGRWGLAVGEDEDGKFKVYRGDGWVLAVEFSDPPRAYSILAYGNSNREASPYYYDQAELFADNRMKPVAFTEEDIRKDLVMRYHPGEERNR